MELYEELNISLEKRELISITGGGGKTTSMFKLGKELLSKGKKVLISTTTAIFKPRKDCYENLYLTKNTDYKDIRGSASGLTIIGKEISKNGKLMGISGEIIDEIFKMKTFDYIIVEADGSKRKSIKAPASHEPVIPSLSTQIIALIGMDCLYKKIYEENVHRADKFCSVTNSKIGDLITEDTIYSLIISKDGIFKGSPIKSKKHLILNKVENEERERVCQEIKDKALLNKIDINIISGSMGKQARVTGIIMASGFSRRMKTDKLLLKLGDKTVLERVIDACMASQLDEVLVVYRSEKIKDIANSYDLKVVLNEKASRGQSESIKVGINNIDSNTDGIMFIVADQPLLDSETIDVLINKFKTHQGQIIIPRYGETTGNPTIFPATFKDQLNSLLGDRGGREIINKNLKLVSYVDVKNHKAGMDMDTAVEYEKLKEEF